MTIHYTEAGAAYGRGDYGPAARHRFHYLNIGASRNFKRDHHHGGSGVQRTQIFHERVHLNSRIEIARIIAMQEFTPVAFRIRASDYPQAHVTKPAPDSGHHFMAKLFETYDVWKMAKGADIKNLQLFGRGHGNKPAQVYSVGYHHCAIGGCSFG